MSDELLELRLDPKPFWKSKTFWVAVAAAALSLESHIQGFIAENPGLVGSGLSALFLGLRLITGVPVKIK